MLEGLMACDEFEDSPVYVFCDGPRNPAQIPDVAATRAIVKQLLGSRATITEAAENQGLASSIIHGVDHVIEKHGKIIVVEDDLIVSSNFLSYLNHSLARFETSPQVMQISGYMFDYDKQEQSASLQSLFLPFPSSWGWATWARAWRDFDPAANGWERLFKDSKARERFDLDNAYDYSSMLYGQMVGHIDSWAIRWYWSIFMKSGLVLYPPRSLVQNRGFDGSGSHGSWTARLLDTSLERSPVESWIYPSKWEVDKRMFEKIKQCLRNSKGGVLHRIWRSRVGYWARAKLNRI